MPYANEKTPSNRRTATRELRRQQLINATIDSISKRGFSGTTLATVTKGAKLSHGIVNFHFDSKEALYVETLAYLSNEHFNLWKKALQEAGSDPAKQLVAIVETDFHRKICSPKKLAVWFAFWGQAKYRPNYLTLYHEHDDERFDELCRLCTEIVVNGQYDHDPIATARCLEAMIDGLWLNLLLYPNATSREESRNDGLSYLAVVFPKHFSPIEKVSD